MTNSTNGGSGAAAGLVNLKSLSHKELAELIESLGQPGFRTKQIEDWLWNKNVSSLDEMTNLPKTLREALAAKVSVGGVEEVARQVSSDGSRKYLLASLDQSLKRLGVDYVDIFYHHRPDPETPLEETMGALAQAVRSGKALYVGLSNYDGETMRRAADILEQLHCPYIINQNRYSILDRETERNGILDASADRKKGVIIYSPLAQGMLTDRYLHGIPEDSRIRTDGRFLQASQLTEERLAQLRQLQAIAQDRGQTLAQLALCWILRQKAVTSVLVGASRPEQITDTLQIVGQKPLTDEELRAVDAAVGL